MDLKGLSRTLKIELNFLKYLFSLEKSINQIKMVGGHLNM